MRVAPLLASSLLIASPASASTYEALCADTPCTISLDANGISSPSGFIPTSRIAQWFTGGQEGYNAGSGTAGALGVATVGAIGGGLLLGPIGLLGGLIGGGLAGSKAGKTADLFFNVVGYDQSGKKTTVSIRFVNPKPANKLKMELPALVHRPCHGPDPLHRRAAQRRCQWVASRCGRCSAGHPDTCIEAAAGDRCQTTCRQATHPAAGITHTRASEEKWQAYLKDRGLEQWASTNPKMAEQLKQRL